MADIFDKLKVELKKATVKSSTLIEVTKIKSDISALKKRKCEYHEKMGEKLHTMIKENNVNLDDFNEMIDTLNKIDNSISEKENEITELENKKDETVKMYKENRICSCGSQVQEDARFCSTCGVEVKPKAQESKETETSETKTSETETSNTEVEIISDIEVVDEK